MDSTKLRYLASGREEPLTPQKLARGLLSFSPEQLANMDHATLYQAREYAPPEHQGLLAPYEHRAFAREATAENPLLGPAIVASILPYQAYKAFNGARSAPSWDQVGQGFLGVGEGLKDAVMQNRLVQLLTGR